jgi:hypothetical protein
MRARTVEPSIGTLPGWAEVVIRDTSYRRGGVMMERLNNRKR